MASSTTKKVMELDPRIQQFIEAKLKELHDPLEPTPQDVAMHHRKNEILWKDLHAWMKEMNEYGRAADEPANTTAGTATAN